MKKLSANAILAASLAVPDWSCRRGQLLRTYEFPSFVAAMGFVNAVARVAERLQHHPDIDIRWNRVVLVLTTHDAGGLTELDFQLAARCDRLAARRSVQVHS